MNSKKDEDGAGDPEVWNSCLIFRGRFRRAEIDLGLCLERDDKSNKGFYKQLNCKMETRANVVPLLNGHRELVKNDVEKAKALSAAFTSGFASKTRFHDSLAPETHGKV